MTIPTYTPAQVRAARTAAGHTQTEAASLIYRKLRTWQDWEAGVARADPALIELYLIKTGQSPYRSCS